MSPATSQRARTTFCWLPPDRRPICVPRCGVRIERRSIHCVDQGGLLLRDHHRPGAARLLLGQHHVVRDRHRSDHALDLALGRHVADARRDRTAGSGQVELLAVQGDLAGQRRLGAEQGPAHVLASGAVHADDADDLPGADLEVHVAEGAARHALHDQARPGRPVGVLGEALVVVVVGSRGPDHHPVQVGRLGTRGRHLPHGLTAAQHADAVAHVEHLVEAVRDEDDGGELAEPAHLRRRGSRSPPTPAPRWARRG